MSRWQWLLSQLVRRLWFRAGLFSLLGVVTALVAIAVRPFIPPAVSVQIGAEAVDNILGIMASSMLAVTTFSLGAMVSAYASAASGVTPRATRLLLQDTTAQNALSTFLGAFLFSIVGIIALSTGLYGGQGRVVLFAATLVVIVVVVVTLLRWIEYLSRLGRLGETTRRVEEAAAEALDARRRDPHMCAQPPPAGQLGAVGIEAGAIGYLQHLDVPALNALAGEIDSRIDVLVMPGAFLSRRSIIARTDRRLDEGELKTLHEAFSIGDQRSFDQDPRFGLSVLAEIASRALSPAVNDPGTAIDIIGRGVRLLSDWARPCEAAEVRFENVTIPPLATADLFDDLFTPIARDGAGLVEIGLRLQKAFAMLAEAEPDILARDARRHAALAFARAEAELPVPEDVASVRAVRLL
jgi:uncharacterized membrane protein